MPNLCPYMTSDIQYPTGNSSITYERLAVTYRTLEISSACIGNLTSKINIAIIFKLRIKKLGCEMVLALLSISNKKPSHKKIIRKTAHL